MAEQFDINNLTLDDNTFEVLPDGDYHFLVKSHEVGYAQSDKMPANTQQITCYLEIPYMKDGELKVAEVRNNLNLYRKALFAIRQFAESIGMVPEKGRANLDLTQMNGLEGICALTSMESKKTGNAFNNVQTFYPPSKAPAVTANDEAWSKYKNDDFLSLGNEDVPFV